MRIIFDFDHTLFDTPRLKAAMQEIFRKHGVDEELFRKTHDESRGEGRDWKPEKQFDILKSLGAPGVESIRRDFEKMMAESCVFLYEDTIPFLEKVNGDYNFAIVTYGESSFQKEKLAGCHRMTEYFDKIVVTKNLYKDKEVSDLSEGNRAFFVEDNPSALSAVKKYAPHIVTVRMNRGHGRYANEVSQGGIDYEVEDLAGVEILLGNL